MNIDHDNNDTFGIKEMCNRRAAPIHRHTTRGESCYEFFTEVIVAANVLNDDVKPVAASHVLHLHLPLNDCEPELCHRLQNASQRPRCAGAKKSDVKALD